MAVKSREYALPALPTKSELGSHYFIPNGVGNNVDHYIGVSGGLFAKVDTGGGGGGGGITDGDKGDITVSASGTIWIIDPNVVTYAKMQTVTTNKLLGSGTGTSVQEITLGPGLFFTGSTLNVTSGGGGGGSTQVFNETPTGTQDAVNIIFTTSLPFVSGTTRLYLNGQRLKLGDDYFETGNTQITYFLAPHSTDNIIIDYQLT